MKRNLMYLRKSRTDNPDISVEEVLEKHETILQELAVREFGAKIPEDCIFREVVSGETIEQRPEMGRVLAMIEDPETVGVLVVDPQRLSRGDLEDCGKMVNAFRYTNTQVVTPNMSYDLTNKMQRKFFEQELMRGNDYLEYTKEILLRGRVASVKKGNYIGNTAPFGYDKVRIDGSPSLKPNENAEFVKMAFEMYANEGKLFSEIAKHLDDLGVKPMRGDHWEKCSIREILKNEHYIGMVRFGYKRTEKSIVDGHVIKRRNRPAEKEDMILAHGKHKAIVSEELFYAAQERLNNNPRAKWDAPLKNPLAGVFFCAKCGKAIAQHPYKKALDRFECRNRAKCGSKSAPMDEVIDALLHALTLEELPHLEAELKNDSGKAAEIQKRQVEKMSSELDELRKQEDKQYELLEKGFYTEEKFLVRHKDVIEKIDKLKMKIYNAKQVIPKEVDYSSKIVKLQDAIDALRNDDLTAKEKNKFVRAIIKRIEYEFLSYEGRGKVRYALHIQLLI